LLEHLGFGEVWSNQGVCNERLFLMHVKQRLEDVFIQDLRNRLGVSTRADVYRNMTDTFEYKLYLNVVTVGKFRVALSRFRTSSHRLCIESGRWHKPIKTPRSERKCQFCNVIEDECHFMLECPKYAELRTMRIPAYYHKKTSMFKCVELLNCENNNTVRKCAMFIYKAFQLRNNLLYSN
jgi:hypothetical protein